MIPINTTTISVKGRRPQVPIDPDADGYDPPPTPPVILASGVRATISLPSFKRDAEQAGQIDQYALRCDPIEVGITRYDTIIDESTDVEYSVESVGPSLIEQFGLAHIVAYVKIVRGGSDVRP